MPRPWPTRVKGLISSVQGAPIDCCVFLSVVLFVLFFPPPPLLCLSSCVEFVGARQLSLANRRAYFKSREKSFFCRQVVRSLLALRKAGADCLQLRLEFLTYPSIFLLLLM